MSASVLNVGGYEVVSATGNVAPQAGSLIGVFVSAASSTPTITVYDSSTTTTTKKMVDTFTPVAGTWYPMPFATTEGIYVVIGGTVSATFSFV